MAEILIIQYGNDQAAAEQVFFSLTAEEDSLELPFAFSVFSGELFAAESVVDGAKLPADPELLPELLHDALL
jgi:ribosomal protein L10